MTISTALGNLINDWGWVVIIALVFGTGEVLTRIFDGRRRLAQVRGELEGLRVVNESLERRVALHESMDSRKPLQMRGEDQR